MSPGLWLDRLGVRSGSGGLDGPGQALDADAQLVVRVERDAQAQMAAEIERIIDAGLPRGHTISMGGHEDGIITWGESLDAAGHELLMLLDEL